MGTVAMTSDARVLQALLRNDFRAFVHKVFATLSPGQARSGVACRSDRLAA